MIFMYSKTSSHTSFFWISPEKKYRTPFVAAPFLRWHMPLKIIFYVFYYTVPSTAQIIYVIYYKHPDYRTGKFFQKSWTYIYKVPIYAIYTHSILVRKYCRISGCEIYVLLAPFLTHPGIYRFTFNKTLQYSTSIYNNYVIFNK